jgi:solute:Na+ symporter, SSS family
MSLFDWLVVLLYTVAVLVIGNHMRRRVRNAGGFLLGNRKLGTPMMVASTFAGGINANNPISVASNTYTNGLSGMWLTLAFVLATPVFWMWPPVLRRLRIVTLVDFFRMRYGRGMEWIKLIITLIVAPFTFGVGLKAAAMLVVAVAGQGPNGEMVIGMHTAIAMVALPALVYTLLGGVVAAYAVDMFQSLLIIFLSFILLPFMVWRVGGIAEVVERVDAHNPQAWNLVGGASGVPAVWLVWFAVSLFLSAPAVYGAGSGAARNEMAARWALLGNLGKRFCTVGWGLTGLFAIAAFGAPAVSAINPDDVFAFAVVNSLPAGLRGVMVAAMLAAAMSSLAGMMLTFSGSVVNNLYKDYLVRGASPDHYLKMARVFTILPMGLGWVVAASGLGLIHLVVITEQVNSTLGITMLAALMWRRTTGIAAVLATSAMVPLFYFGNLRAGRWPEWYRWLVDRVLDLYQWVGIHPQVDPEQLPSLRPELLLQLTTPIYLTAGLVILVVVSLFTRQHNERAVAEFYARADTPLGQEERLRQMGFQADTIEEMDRQTVNAAVEDSDRSHRLLLLDFLTWPWLVLTRRARLSDYWIDFAGIAGSIIFITAFLWSIASLASFLR